jgi:TolB-like protein/Tfp pilus assembly protein PilF
MSLFAELKRRNVLRVAIAYVAVSWLLIQVAETVFPLYGFSDAAIRMVISILAIGFIPVLVVSWVFEFTPEGLKRDAEVERSADESVASGKRFDRIVLVVFALAIGYFAVDKFVLDPARDAEMAEEVAEQVRTEAMVDSFGSKSIAVLPFVNMSSDPEQSWFSDGIAEELLNLLAKVPELRVTSRSSSFSFRGDEINIADVADKLNVAYVLEGSVRKAGNEVRITAQLIEARSDTHLWSETYDRELDDIFTIQDEVAAQVVEQLQVNLLGEVPKATPVNVDAYPFILQARQIVGLLNLDEFPKAEILLKRALDIDPNYVDALMTLGTVYWYQRNWQQPTDNRAAELEESMDQLWAQVRSLDPDNVRLKTIEAWDADTLQEAARLLEEAADIDPAHYGNLRLSAQFASNLGKTDLAIRIYRYLAERNPLELWVHMGAGHTYLAAGRIEDGLRHLETAASLSPNTDSVNWRLGHGRLVAGDPAGALADFEREVGENYALQGRAMALHDLGRLAESAEAMKLMHEFESQGNFSWPFGFARAYGWMGKADEAFRYLELTAELHPDAIEGVGNHPLLTKLHGDPRWTPFLESIGQAPEQLAEIRFNPRLPYELSSQN